MQLLRGVSGDKAEQLRRLGFDPTLGVALNFAYSTTAVVVLIYAWRGRRTKPRRGREAADRKR